MSLLFEYGLLVAFSEIVLHWYSRNKKKIELLCKKDITNLIACSEFQISRTENTILRIEQALT